MRTSSAEIEARDEPSLYEQIVDATGISYDRDTFSGGIEDYKNKLVRHFGSLSEDEFDDLPEEIRDWINEATIAFNANRRTKEERSPLPDIEGLVEPPVKARRARVVVDDDEEEEAPAPVSRRQRVTAAPPEDEEDDDGLEDDGDGEDDDVDEEEVIEEPEEEAPPPQTAKRTRATRVKAAPAPKPKAPPRTRTRRDPDSGRYAKVMPHYLRHRNIDLEELQRKIEKGDGDDYSITTLDRTLAACRSVVGWLERNGVDLRPLSK